MDLKGPLTRGDRTEKFILLGVAVGVLLTGIGIASTVIATQGITAALALVGSFITFVSTVVLVLYWFARGDGKKRSE